jgi:acylphosphatase
MTVPNPLHTLTFPAMLVTKHLVISGRVQGVGFRFHMEKIARALGATGWVRNRADGSVEATVQGSPQAVDAMIDAARRGPRSAVVTNVAISDGSGSYSQFEQRPTE